MSTRAWKDVCSKPRLLACCTLIAVFAPLANCDTISLATAANPSTIGSSSGSFTFTGASVPSSNLSALPALLDSGLSNSFGVFSFNASSANQNVVDLSVTPTVNGQTTKLDFTGDLASAVIGGTTYYSLNFSSTPNSHIDDNASTGNVDYTALAFDGYDFAVRTSFQLNAGNVGKQTWVWGYITPSPTSVPEPLSAASTGLAILTLLGIALRRKLLGKLSSYLLPASRFVPDTPRD